MENCLAKDHKIEQFEPRFVAPLIGLHVATSLSTIVLNALIIVTIWRTPSLRTPSRILLCNLALSDFFMAVVAQPLFILYCLAALQQRTDVFCITWAVNKRVGYCLAGVSLLTLTIISVDRLLAVKIAVSYKLVVTKRRVVRLLILSWILVSVGISIAIEFLDIKRCMQIGSVLVVLALLVISFSYSLSFHGLKKMSKVEVPNVNAPPPTRQGTSFNISKYRRSLVTMLMLLGLSVLTYLPLICVIVSNMFVKIEKAIVYLHYSQFVIAFSATINPIFYLWRMRDLRIAAKDKLSSIQNICSE